MIYQQFGSLAGMRPVDKAAFGRRVAERRTELGLSQPDVAKAIGMKQQGVDAIEKGRVSRPRLLHELAAVLKTSAEWLLWEEGPKDVSSADETGPFEQSPPESGRSALRRPLRIKGEVAAGHWLEIELVDEPKHDEIYPIAFDPRYPEEAQYGLIVRGTSINRVAGPGEILHCVDLGISGIDPRQEDLVIVERRRAQAGQKEVTAKRFRTKGRIIELAPESNDKRWVTPLALDPKKAPDGEEIAIIAIVVGVYKPLKRI